MTKQRYGIIGWPVAHSLSPRMQEAAFTASGMDVSYDLISAKPDDLAQKTRELKSAGYLGWNVTVPHKQSIISLLDDIEPTAKFAGSVNTIVNREGKLHGYSTDGYGLEMSIKETFGLRVFGGTFLFWGTGGAATSASAHFAMTGARKIYLVNRTLEKAYALKERLDQLGSNIQTFVLNPKDTVEIKRVFRDVDVIIQSTNLGLRKKDPISIPKELLSSPLNIIDMIYSQTPLLKEAINLGCQAVDGRGMLLHQGAKSFSIWTGIEAPVEIMRAALNQVLDHTSL